MMSQQRALVRMPEVVGLPLRKARLLIENAGLAVDAIVFQETYDARDTVLTQKPARGQMIYSGEKVTLGISRESYVKWLPSIYQRHDINNRNFLRDLLWIVQHLFTSIDEQLDVIHNFFDPYEAPEKFLPWLATWSAMILEEDWPLTKKRRLIKKGIEMYRIRGTVKGVKLFISLFTGHEPEIKENIWPFRGWRVGITSELGIDSVVLPPVNLAHTFVVEMPVSYKDISPEAVIRIHEIIQMEKPANTQYYLRFAIEGGPSELREFYVIGTRSGVGVESAEAITSEEELQKVLEAQNREEAQAAKAKTQGEEVDDGFTPASRARPPLPKAPRADTAPVEGREGPRSSEAGGFGSAAREMKAITDPEALEVMATSEMPAMSTKTGVTPPVDPKKTATTKAVKDKDKDKDKKDDEKK